MKRKIIILILLLLLFLIDILIIYFSPNSDLILEEILCQFKPTVDLDISINADDVKEIEILGVFDVENPDEGDYGDNIYTDKYKIEKIIHYLDKLPLAKSSSDKLPNRSADGWVYIYDADGRDVVAIALYGSVFIKDLHSDQVYMCKESLGDVLFEGLFE